MTTKHTPGPWFTDVKGNIWRRHPSTLYENGGDVGGDKPLAYVVPGWSGEGYVGYPVEANAHLIAAAPDLLEFARAVVRYAGCACDDYLADKARDVIAKATGGEKLLTLLNAFGIF